MLYLDLHLARAEDLRREAAHAALVARARAHARAARPGRNGPPATVAPCPRLAPAR